MQYKLPQDTGSEDYFVWKLSLRQLIILFIGFGVAYMIYISLANKVPSIVYIIPIALIALLTLAFAFIRKDNMSFIRMILILIEMQINPMKRFWIPRAATPSPFDLLANLNQGNTPPPVTQPTTSAEKHIEQLSSLAALLDHNRVEPLARIDEQAEGKSQQNNRESLLEKFAEQAAQQFKIKN